MVVVAKGYVWFGYIWYSVISFIFICHIVICLFLRKFVESFGIACCCSLLVSFLCDYVLHAGLLTLHSMYLTLDDWLRTSISGYKNSEYNSCVTVDIYF